jgi:hypothetical protein
MWPTWTGIGFILHNNYQIAEEPRGTQRRDRGEADDDTKMQR